MTARIGLYYPYTHFRDDTWLKSAALYWTGMARIVPSGVTLGDSATTKALREELGFVVDVSPEPAIEAVTTVMLAALDEFGDYLCDRYRLPDRPMSVAGSGGAEPPTGPADPGRIYRHLLSPMVYQGSPPRTRWPDPDDPDSMSFNSVVGLHGENLDARLIAKLTDLGVAATTPGRPWLGVHPNLGWAYMCVLADELAARNRLSPVTDQSHSYYRGVSWSAERLAEILLEGVAAPRDPRPELTPEVLGSLTLRLVVPADLDRVPVKRIIRLRQRHAAEFDAYLELVERVTAELATELSDIDDPSVAAAYLRTEVATRFERPVAELRKALRGNGIDAALGTTSTRFELPAAAAALAGGWSYGQPAVAAAGAALGLVTLYRGYRRARSELRSASPVSYLWTARRELRHLTDEVVSRW